MSFLVVRKIWTAALLAGILVTALFGQAQQAGAADATLDPCVDSTPASAFLWQLPLPETSDYRGEGICHFTFGLRTDESPTQFSGMASLPQGMDPTIAFSRVSFDLSGGDGSDGGLLQTVRVCGSNGEGCSASVRPSSANVFLPEHHEFTTAGGSLPERANRIIVSGYCVAGHSCSPARALEITNIKMVIADSSVPMIAWQGNAPGSAVLPDHWNSGSRVIPVRASDLESGVKRVVFAINGAEWAEEDSRCGTPLSDTSVPAPCALQTDFVHKMTFASAIGIYPVRNGVNTASVYALDVAGNQSDPLDFTFKVDTHPPVVAGLRATGANSMGWQSGPSIDLEWTNSPENLETATQSGVASATYDIDPVSPGAANPQPVTLSGAGIDHADHIVVPQPGVWRIAVATTDKSGLKASPESVVVGVDPAVLDAPSIATPPLLGASDLERGAEIEWEPPGNITESLSKVCGYAMSVDRNEHADPGVDPELPGTRLSARLPTYLPSGTHYVHLRAVSCAGVGGLVADEAVHVDADGPAIRVSDPGPGNWYSQEHPLVVSTADADEPGTAVSYAVDGVTSPPEGSGTATIPLLDGSHSVVVEATDGLGNATALALVVRADSSSPAAAFALFDPAHPTIINATARDEYSGMSEAYIQYRSSAGGAWRLLGGIKTPAGAVRSSLEVNEIFPDVGAATGAYELRVNATDVAGHMTTATTRVDGTAAGLSVPLRGRPWLTAEISTAPQAGKCARTGAKKKKQEACSRRLIPKKGPSVEVAYGQKALVGGKLRLSSGEPGARERLDVYEDVIAKGETKVGSVTTDAGGRYSFHTKPGPSRRVTVRWVGSNKELPASAGADLFCRSRVSLTVSRHHVRRLGTVVFSGRLRAVGAVFPPSGKEVKFQQKIGRTWRNFVLDALAGPDGRFRAAYRAGRVRRPLKLRIRAAVPGADGWAYEAGVSRPVSLVVR